MPAISDQTKTDLRSILEILGQRLHEVDPSNTDGQAVSNHERAALGKLKDATQGVLLSA